MIFKWRRAHTTLGTLTRGSASAAKVYKFGPTRRSTRESGLITAHMVRARSSALMETLTRESGEMTSLMDMALLPQQTIQRATWVSGAMIFITGRARKAGQMVPTSRASSPKERRMDPGLTYGLMAPLTLENGSVTRCVAKATTNGRTVEATSERG